MPLDARSIDSLGADGATFARSLSRHACTRTLLLTQLSARPWLLTQHLVVGGLQSLSTTQVFDAMLHELAVNRCNLAQNKNIIRHAATKRAAFVTNRE